MQGSARSGQPRRLPNEPVCSFCGSPCKLTKQHIVPRKLHPDVLDDSDGHTRRRFGMVLAEDGLSYLRIRDEDNAVGRSILKNVSRTPCGSCNSGWMNQLEQSATPLLTRLFSLYQNCRAHIDPTIGRVTGCVGGHGR
jgi:hypothetical protein